MSEDSLNPRETILRMCAAAAPEPWYPRLYAKQEGVEPAALAECLEEMGLDGLIRKAPGNAETGPEISLTEVGERVLLDSEALERLRSGQPLSPDDRGALVRQVFRSRLRPYVTQLLVLGNVLVFALGYYDARQKGADNHFLNGNVNAPVVRDLLEQSGSLSARSLIDGEWWRLVTAGFVHVGILSLLLNMVFLYMAGRYIEQMWGHLRFLAIYLSAVLGAGCLAVVHNLRGDSGAFGAVCGLLGAEAVWFLFNRKYLMRSLMRQLRWSLISSFVLLMFLLLFKDANNWGLFGGAVSGALAALLLHLQRFGPPLWRWLALAGFAPLAWYGHNLIDHARATDGRWQKVEDQQFEERYAGSIGKSMKQAKAIYAEQVTVLLRLDPPDRDPDKVESVLALLEGAAAGVERLGGSPEPRRSLWQRGGRTRPPDRPRLRSRRGGTVRARRAGPAFGRAVDGQGSPGLAPAAGPDR